MIKDSAAAIVTQYGRRAPAETSAETCRPACTRAVSRSVQQRCAPAIGLRSAAIAVVAAKTESGMEAFRVCDAPSKFRFGCRVAESARPHRRQDLPCHVVLLHGTSHRQVASTASARCDWMSCTRAGLIQIWIASCREELPGAGTAASW